MVRALIRFLEGASGGETSIGPEHIALAIAGIMEVVFSSIATSLIPEASAAYKRSSGAGTSALLSILDSWGKSWQEIAAITLVGILAGVLIGWLLYFFYASAVFVGLSKVNAGLLTSFLAMLGVVLPAIDFFVNNRR